MPSCIFCEQSTGPILDLGPQPVSNRFLGPGEGDRDEYAHPLVLGRCGGCGLLQLIDPMPAREVVPRYDWIQYNEPEGHLDAVADRIAGRTEVGREASLGGLTYKDESTLRRLRERGFVNTRVLDPADDLGITEPRAGLETIQERLTPEAARAFAERNGKFDFLIARHLLEHAHDPRRFLEAVRELVAPGGCVLFEVPDFSKCLANRDYCFLWEEHIVYFVAETLKITLARQGFEEIDLAVYDYPFENSLVCLLRVDGSGGDPGVEKKAEPDAARSFGDAFAARKEEVRNALVRFREKEGGIAAFGAGHLACKFLNFFDLGDLVEFVVDDHPDKQGLRLPGSGVPIVGSGELDSGRVRLVLMSLSPESEEKVLAHQGDRIAKGMRFVSMFEASDRSLMKELHA